MASSSSLLAKLQHDLYHVVTAALIIFPMAVVSATLQVPSHNVSYPSMPAIYYGKPWAADKVVTARLQYYDVDWCLEADLLDPQRSPVIASSSSLDGGDDDDDDLPVILLANDEIRADAYGEHPCQLVDFERLSSVWNVSHIIFYDAIDRPLSYIWSYLDEQILSEHNAIGFQLVSFRTGMELRSLILEQQKEIHTSADGIIIHVDGTLAIDDPGPRIDTAFVRRRKAIVFLPKLAGLFSLLGSSYIIFDILGTRRGRERKLKLTFNRLLVGLSIADIFSSLANFLSHWMVPSEPQFGADPEWYNAMFPYASGNDATCNVQGFMLQAGQCGSVLFTAFISIQFVLQVRYRWTEGSMRKVEKFFLALGTILPIGTASFMVAVGGMNITMGGFCWIEGNPFACLNSYVGWCKENKSWGANLDFYKFVMGSSFILSGLVVVLGSMILLFCTARAQERRASRWSTNAQRGQAQKAVIVNASLYLGVYVAIYVSVILVLQVRGTSKIPLVLLLPSQGFFNAMVYSKKYQIITQYCPAWCCCTTAKSRDNNCPQSSNQSGQQPSFRSYLGFANPFGSSVFFTPQDQTGSSSRVVSMKRFKSKSMSKELSLDNSKPLADIHEDCAETIMSAPLPSLSLAPPPPRSTFVLTTVGDLSSLKEESRIGLVPMPASVEEIDGAPKEEIPEGAQIYK